MSFVSLVLLKAFSSKIAPIAEIGTRASLMMVILIAFSSFAYAETIVSAATRDNAPVISSMKSEVKPAVRPLQILTYEAAPFAFVKQGKEQGLLVELIAEMFARAQLDYQLTFMPLKRGLLKTLHSAQHCITPIERTQEREASYRWISPMLISRYGLYSSSQQKIHLASLSDAKSLTIGSYLGSGIAEYLMDLGYEVELASLRSQNIKKLQYNRIDLMASELMSARSDMDLYGVELGEPELIFYTSIRAMACNVNLDTKIKNRLDSALLAMYQDGFIDALYAEYGVRISL
ncbi:substrate-binding periplasmic protein [Shewanella pneumatophori]|uniref:Transporter substrate-binding domain-containing protein n=1 Tax=Shewanella pneumatophori TaxID=314092 RepID=A0A9X2CEK5_9GAMM|nr:transporter substrate-binding domain-containing protein [Shewanella pneumatophori]MCL1140358.1 transporter substrate-binding domain-containing protein [Shewanella pneumatophori]